MDWSLLITLLALLIVGAAASLYLHAFIARIRKEFRATQPDLRITNLSAMNSENVLTIFPELENVGLGVGYDCVMHLGGWEGNFAVKNVHPRGPRYQKHVASIALGPETPIRAKPITNGYLRLSYRDRWGLKYECWYPVTQVRGGAPPLYNFQIDLEHPEFTKPAPSFWEMRRLLRNRSLND